VFEKALSVTQNNIGNASTPGYVKQRLLPQAMAFDPDRGLSGGVRAGPMDSSRVGYAEQNVRQRLEDLAKLEQKTSSLTAIENVLTISAETGIPGALNRLLETFSAWSLSPASGTAREGLLEQAAAVAHAFQQTAGQLVKVSQETETRIAEAADYVNTLAGRLQEYNRLRRQGGRSDAGLDARIHSTLEELSQVVNASVLYQEDGTVTVLLGGQSLLVVGENVYPVATDYIVPAQPPPTFPDAAPRARVIDAGGRDITNLLTGGRLGALLDVRNDILPSLLGDAYTEGNLNQLAATVANQVNGVFADAVDESGQPATFRLLAYDVTNPTAAAKSLSLSPLADVSTISARDAGPPPVSNGIALRLAALAGTAQAALGGLTFTESYGSIAAVLGRQLADASGMREQQEEFVSQARAFRNEISGVSLDEEAVILLQYQRAYQATARTITVLDKLTEETINLLR
jgi:flagellar hook-associated protein 1 FlgK